MNIVIDFLNGVGKWPKDIVLLNMSTSMCIILSGRFFKCLAVILEGPGAFCFLDIISFLSSSKLIGGNVISNLSVSAN